MVLFKYFLLMLSQQIILLVWIAMLLKYIRFSLKFLKVRFDLKLALYVLWDLRSNLALRSWYKNKWQSKVSHDWMLASEDYFHVHMHLSYDIMSRMNLWHIHAYSNLIQPSFDHFSQNQVVIFWLLQLNVAF